MKVEHQNLAEAFSEFKTDKNINRPMMVNILEEVLSNLLKRKFNVEDDEAIKKSFNITINVDKGDFEIWHNREVVADGEVNDSLSQISLSDAQKIDADYEVGEDVTEKINIEDFGRREVLSIRQNLISRIMDLEKNHVYEKYKDQIGNIVSGEVYQAWKKEILILDDERNELYLPKSEQIPSDFFRKGDTVRGVVARVEMKNGSPLVIISRTHPSFLERLFEFEVPEILDGLITIKKVVRIPGEKAKVAVESYDERIDPVGACVGMKGSRIHGIVRELKNENIDVINYTSNPQLYIQRALSPAKITSISINEEKKKADVFIPSDQVSLAIGKGGANIKLAIQLTGYDIDVYRDNMQEEEDVDLDEFTDEIDEWIIDELKKVGCDTAKSVLRLSKEELVRRTDLEEETIDDVVKILREEFED
ncbi:MAG: transcription termination factor NusA [Bacteroidales bacterium]|nr:transcription termination/antitermination protein NusA [Bacteroidales bacterium]MBR4350399.1 transcription termination/antitermination protein NusA [Bacteroidales bacterium]MBR6265506.1 transcription termination/antitermination protein NusA [Bacteroidales bacterium]MCR4801153.1 transcription termination factor NusA [Bacteroidales bacterium]